jgi:hypothetical protein
VWVVYSVLVAFVAGLVKILSSLREVNARAARASEFAGKFRRFANGVYREHNFDSVAYEWLLKKSGPMQNELGALGLIAYRPAFQNYVVQSYQVLFNTIPEIRAGTAHETMVATCDDCLLRYLGFVEDIHTEVLRRLRNPLLWLRDGARLIVSLPFTVLKWLGVLPAALVSRISESFVLKFISGLIAAIGLLASAIQITTGWTAFEEWIRRHM